jgi:aldose 1-epimerase
MESPEMLMLQSGPASLVLAPETGGAILGWTIGSRLVLRRALPDAIIHGQVRGLAGFPLAPFCNRIAYGRFQWGGREYLLDRNFGDHPHAIHGVGWQSAWTVAAASGQSATLSLTHDPGGAQARRWPFAFAATQEFALTEAELRITLSAWNLHDQPAPFGLGLHPYFPRATYAAVRFAATHVWLTGPDSLPSRRVAIPPEWDHRTGRAIGSAELDNCFEGWDGVLDLDGPDLSVTMETSPLWRHIQVYTPAGQDFFCAEPVSHMPDALHHPEHPMTVLSPGEMMQAHATFRVAFPGAPV